MLVGRLFGSESVRPEPRMRGGCQRLRRCFLSLTAISASVPEIRTDVCGRWPGSQWVTVSLEIERHAVSRATRNRMHFASSSWVVVRAALCAT